MTAPTTPAPAAPAPAPVSLRPLRRWLSLAGLGLVAAGALHVAAAVDHLGAGELAVGFFLLTAAAQLGGAAWFALAAVTGSPPRRELVAMALFGTVALVGLYLVAHTTALLDAFAVPADDAGGGHDHGSGVQEPVRIDPVTGVDFSTGMGINSDGPVAMGGEVADTAHGADALGTATVAAELLTIAGLAALLPATWRGWATNILLGLGGLTWLLWFTGVLG